MSEHGWVYEEDGVVVYRASSLGSCQRSLVAARLGESPAPFNASIRAAMDASSDMEAEAIAEYEKVTGHTVIWQQKTVELPLTLANIDPDGQGGELYPVIIRGHIDGLDQELDCIIEVKCLSGRNFASYDTDGLDGSLAYLKRRYEWQAAVYGYATERPVRWVIYNKHAEGDDDLIIIGPVNPSSDIVPMSVISQKIRFVEQCAEVDDLPPCDANCKEGDSFSEAHIFASPMQGGADLEALLREERRINKLIGSPSRGDKPGKGLLGELDDIKQTIKLNYGIGKHVAGPYTANVSRVVSKRLSTTLVKKGYPEVYEDCLEESETVKLVVTGPPEKEEARDA